MAHSFEDIGKEGAHFFQNLYQEMKGCPIQEIMEVISIFSPVFSDDMNKKTEEEVTKVKVLGALSSMQKGKSSGLYGLTIKNFIGFYDILKD
jgi:hypothetical protein